MPCLDRFRFLSRGLDAETRKFGITGISVKVRLLGVFGESFWALVASSGADCPLFSKKLMVI
jgi:hypothetical protein